MKYFWLIAFLGLSACAAQAAQNTACPGAKTQLAMNACASKQATQANGQLSAVYGKLLSEAASKPNGVAKVKAMEAAWVAYRMAYIDATYPAANKSAEYGSIYPMQVDLLWASLTRQHIQDLKAILQTYSCC